MLFLMNMEHGIEKLVQKNEQKYLNNFLPVQTQMLNQSKYFIQAQVDKNLQVQPKY